MDVTVFDVGAHIRIQCSLHSVDQVSDLPTEAYLGFHKGEAN